MCGFNVGSTDRSVRAIIGLVSIVIGMKYNTWWFVVAAYMFLTSIFGWCPIYSIFGKSESRKIRGSEENPIKVSRKKSKGRK